MKSIIRLKSNISPVTDGDPLNDPKFTEKITDVVSLNKTMDRRPFYKFTLTDWQSKLRNNPVYCLSLIHI